jgi:formyltetrahydrofolate-dependent phosphoribosylglycinamide formyltransferase
VKARRVGVLLSGRGSNMRALVERQAPGCGYEICCVLSNNADAGGLDVAREAGVPTAVVDHRPFGKNRKAFEIEVDVELARHGVEIVALAGFMRVLTPFFVERWAGRLINIHPSLLPLFPGLDTHARALAAGVKVHGCSVHWVNAEVDGGKLIGQAVVPVRANDTEATLSARVLRAEHALYPAALAQVCGAALDLQAPPDTLLSLG